MTKKRKSKVFITPWTGLPENFNVGDWEGFVYLIVNTLTQKKYVGRKYFWSTTRKRVKGKKRRVVTRKESNWREYKSSSDDLKAEIKALGQDAFTFSILSLHKTRGQTNYTEVKEMFIRDVLYSRLSNGEYMYFNHCILNRYYRRTE